MTRILCLDDESEILDLLALILRPKDYDVVMTTSSYEALDILRTQSIDLVTQDFARPDMSGIEFLQIMKSDAALCNIPVLGVSARPREARAEELKQAGLDIDRDLAGYVEKPFGPHELLNAVETALSTRATSLDDPPSIR